MGVEPENINSDKMTKVRRNRYYWHNLPRNIQPLPKTKTFQENLSQVRSVLPLCLLSLRACDRS
jgi:hypothetical protein